MGFQMPETLDGLSADKLAKLLSDAEKYATELNAIADEEITAEQSAALIEVVGHIDAIATRHTEVVAEETASAEALANARAAVANRAQAAQEPVEEPAEEPAAEVVEVVEERELVAAKAGGQSFSSRVAAQTPVEAAPKADVTKGALSLVASADISGGFSAGDEMDFDQLAQAFVNRGKAFAGGSNGKAGKPITSGVRGLPTNAQRYPVARLAKADSEFT